MDTIDVIKVLIFVGIIILWGSLFVLGRAIGGAHRFHHRARCPCGHGWRSTAKWFKPWTWGDGEWVEADKE